MKRFFSIIIISVVLLASCSTNINNETNEEVNLLDSIKHYENVLFNNNSNRINVEDAKKLAGFYENYAIEIENDSLTPSFLFKAADINMNMNRPENAIGCFTTILEKYPTNINAPSALFLTAFIYDDQLADYKNAEKYYKLFLEKYPDNDFTDDAEISLKNLGKTPEQLIEEFEEMNK